MVVATVPHYITLSSVKYIRHLALVFDEVCVLVMNVFLLSLSLLFILPPSEETWEELLHLVGLSLSFTVSPGSGTDGPRHLLLGNIFSIRALQDYSWTRVLGGHCSPQTYQPRHLWTLGTHRKVLFMLFNQILWLRMTCKKSHLIIVGFDMRVLWLCSIFPWRSEGRKHQLRVCCTCASSVFVHSCIVNKSTHNFEMFQGIDTMIKVTIILLWNGFFAHSNEWVTI